MMHFANGKKDLFKDSQKQKQKKNLLYSKEGNTVNKSFTHSIVTEGHMLPKAMKRCIPAKKRNSVQNDSLLEIVVFSEQEKD